MFMPMLSVESAVEAPIAFEEIVRTPSFEERYRAGRGTASAGIALYAVGQVIGLVGMSGEGPVLLLGGAVSLVGEGMLIGGSFKSHGAVHRMGSRVGAGWGVVSVMAFAGAPVLALSGNPLGGAAMYTVSFLSGCVFYAQVGSQHKKIFAEDAALERHDGGWGLTPVFSVAPSGGVFTGLGLHAAI